MRIIIDKREFDFINKENVLSNHIHLDLYTSVNQQKAHFFETLGNIGEIMQIEPSLSNEELSIYCSQSDTVYGAFHQEPRENLSCRLLQHTKGSLMLTEGFNCGWSFHDSTMNIVTTKKQLDQLKNGLNSAAPRMGVFTPRLNERDFYLPDNKIISSAKKQRCIENDCFHLVYAGRFLANKGICQLIRALNIWPIAKIQITLIGNVEPNFHISQSNAIHITFDDFFKREVVDRNQRVRLVIERALQQRNLREIYWSSDCFIYPSFHEDENFGMAPREAMLCGVPFIVTDFCGLGQLYDARGGIIKTYPTLGGIRFSLKSLRHQIEMIHSWNNKQRTENRIFNKDFVKEECDQTRALLSLKMSIEEILKLQPGSPLVGGWRSKERIDRWAEIGPESFKKAISKACSPPPEGLYVDGTGYASDGWYSEPHFLQAIQAFYTTYNFSPVVKKGSCYRGFWRVAIWPEEKSLLEFGFPGPRIKRFNMDDWRIITDIAKHVFNGEIEFWPTSIKSVEVVQQLVDLGYLVPDEL